MVKELVAIQGQLILAVTLGKDYIEKCLPYKNVYTGEVKMLELGNYLM